MTFTAVLKPITSSENTANISDFTSLFNSTIVKTSGNHAKLKLQKSPTRWTGNVLTIRTIPSHRLSTRSVIFALKLCILVSDPKTSSWV